MQPSFTFESIDRNAALHCALVYILFEIVPGAVLGDEPAPVSDAQNWSEAERKAYVSFALTHSGNADAGKDLFFNDAKIACAKCHEISGEEKAGPNLKSIANKYRPAELIRHLLDPNETIQSGYGTVVVLMKNGEVLTGTLKGVGKEEYTICDAEGRRLKIQRDQTVRLQVQKTSMMPVDLIAGISREQFADLIAYLNTLRVDENDYRGDEVKVLPLIKPVSFRPFHGPGIKFDKPVWFCPLPGFEKHYVIVEHRNGKIWRMEKTPGGEKQSLFLDFKDSITVEEDGLVCIEFHPQYVQNGRYFLKHSRTEEGQRKSLIVERIAAADRLVDGCGETRRLLEVEQPAPNHNGGCLAFGLDGYLYHAFGDGGPQEDPHGYSQNPRSFLGSIIRIDVDRRDGDRPYGIPDDNPFLDRHRQDPRIHPETWAVGFREPWRSSFDSLTGDLWVGDVGQVRFEEVALVRKGENHGWNVYEGFQGFSEKYQEKGAKYVPPVFAYPRSFGVSVTGGYVYRGDPDSSFYGVYIFADYETRRVWGLKHRDRKLTQIRLLGVSPQKVVSFGVDNGDEIYVVGYEGTIYHLDLSEADYDS